MPSKKDMRPSAITESGDFGEELTNNPYGPRDLYPWDVWADGKPRRLTRVKHFPHATTEALTTACYARARKLRKEGKSVQAICHVEDKDHVVVEFRYSSPQKKTETRTKRGKRRSKKRTPAPDRRLHPQGA